jgi:hypothetical protein
MLPFFMNFSELINVIIYEIVYSAYKVINRVLLLSIFMLHPKK